MTREEAIEIIKKFINGTVLHAVNKEALETLIPEFGESDDERIRRNMVQWFKSYKEGNPLTICDDEIDSWVAYLEKQKYDRMKPIYDARESFESALEKAWNDYHNGYENVDKLEDDYVECAHAKGFREGYLFGIEKQKEQKPELPLMNGDADTYFDDLRIATKPLTSREWFNEGMKYAQRLQKEQKPISFNVPHNPDDYEVVMQGNATGLKRKEQKPAEWDDYTETNLDRALQIIKDAKGKLQGYQSDDGIYECDKAIECLEHFLYSGLEIEKPAEWSEDYREEDIQTRFAFYTYKDDSSVLYLSNVFVEEASRNHGFGTRILIAAEKVAETIGATTISLKVKQNSPANTWYRKRGYGYVAFEDGYDWLEKNLEYMKPKKQEWSEEDEKMLKSIINVVCGVGSQPNGLREKQVNFLKALCPQPKAELTLLDKNIINAAVAFVEQNDHFNYWGGIDKHMVIKALRSLKPHWKPSEEQIGALIYAYCELFKKGDVGHSILRPLQKLCDELRNFSHEIH